MTRSKNQRRASPGFFAAVALAGVLTLASCAASSPPETLFDRMGGEATIDAVVENFLYRIADDPALVGFFANTNIDYLADALSSQFCEVSGGPCRYEGPPMERAHQNMGITDAHFNRLVEHLDAALQAQRVPLGMRNDLLGRLAPMHGDIMRYQ
ncbi:group I truncated hemoglobin [Vreelandella sp. GE22]